MTHAALQQFVFIDLFIQICCKLFTKMMKQCFSNHGMSNPKGEDKIENDQSAQEASNGGSFSEQDVVKQENRGELDE